MHVRVRACVAEHGSCAVLQKNLNMAAKDIELWQVERAVHAQVMVAPHGGGARWLSEPLSQGFQRTPSLMRSLCYAREAGEEAASYDLGTLARKGPPKDKNGGGEGGGGVGGGGEARDGAGGAVKRTKVRVKRDAAVATRAAAAVQTKHDVTSLTTPEAVMSSAHHTVFAAHLPPEHAGAPPPPRAHRLMDPGAAGVQQAAGSAERSSGDASGSFHGGTGEDDVVVVYAGVAYTLKVPRADPSYDRISSVADKLLADHNNEGFVKAAIEHESLLPCPVARCQGAHYALRLPQTSRAEAALWSALAARLPSLLDDYACPMLRVDLAPDDEGTQRHIYLAPLVDARGEQVMGGAMSAHDASTVGLSTAGLDALLSVRERDALQALAVDAVHDAVEAQQLRVTDAQRRVLVTKLIEYSGPHAKWRARRPPPPRAAAEPVGISLTLDQDFDAWVGGGERAGPWQGVGAGRDGGFAGKVRGALAALLQVPVDCIHIAGLNRGSIIVDLNLEQPAGDARTPMQLYEELAAHVANPESAIKADPVLSNAVRVILRGSPHHIPRPSNKAAAEDASGPAAVALPAGAVAGDALLPWFSMRAQALPWCAAAFGCPVPGVNAVPRC